MTTGFSIYSKNLLKHLAETNEFQVAELASYCDPRDPRIHNLPWKVYTCLPSSEQEKQIYDSDPQNVFGKHIFEKVYLDFKPTHVCLLKDWWFDNWIYDSPYRKLFNIIHMPTLDSIRGKYEWYETYAQADALLTYTDFSKRVLEEEANLFSYGEAPACASEHFVPMDKEEVKKSFGISPSAKIIGFVGRNQRRKLFPDLLKSFSMYLKSTGREDILLWVHTAHPDRQGWDFPKLVIENGLHNKVLFTYMCGKCGLVQGKHFCGAKAFCDRCHEWSMKTSNVGGMVPDWEMARIYNAFDLYCQYSNAEGQGIPIWEAAACGTPVVSTNYSAMEDVTTKLEAGKIPYELHEEIETGRLMATPDNKALEKYFEDFFDLPATFRSLEGQKIRQKYVENYSWSKSCNRWVDMIKALPNKQDITPDIKNYEEFKNGDVNNAVWVKWVILKVLGMPEKLGTTFELEMISNLNSDVMSRQNAYDLCKNIRMKTNYFENLRTGNI